MTTNQTIDGVPRELKPCPFCGGEADLKGTAGDYPDWFVQCTECHASVDVFGPGAVHHWNDRKLPAAQPQGEPVAWQYRVSAGPQTGWSLWHDGKGEEFKRSYQVETRPLYAEQPTPVAVDVLITGFHTTESGGGKYAINIGFRSMADMQAADAQLRELLKSR